MKVGPLFWILAIALIIALRAIAPAAGESSLSPVEANKLAGSYLTALQQAGTGGPQPWPVLTNPQTHAAASSSLASISAAASALKVRWQAADEATPQYALSMAGDANALQEVSTETDTARALKQLQAISADLRIKLTHAKATAGATSGLGPDVSVTINTTLNGHPASGYVVQLNVRAEENATTAKFFFTQPSTPTTGTLAAGNYVLWLEKDGKKYSRRYISVILTGDAPSMPPITVPVEP